MSIESPGGKASSSANMTHTLLVNEHSVVVNSDNKDEFTALGWRTYDFLNILIERGTVFTSQRTMKTYDRRFKDYNLLDVNILNTKGSIALSNPGYNMRVYKTDDDDDDSDVLTIEFVGVETTTAKVTIYGLKR